LDAVSPTLEAGSEPRTTRARRKAVGCHYGQCDESPVQVWRRPSMRDRFCGLYRIAETPTAST
jgi:hypothetical protein